MIRFALLGSGSQGNAVLATTSSSKILIDAGLSFRRLEERAGQLGQTLEGLDAILVTHEHSDHVHSVGTAARRLNVPVFMTRGTFENLPKNVGAIPKLELFEAGDAIDLPGLRIESFSVSHDAADPVSFALNAEGVKLGMAADLGHVSQLVLSRLTHSHALVLESNYCPHMLTQGPYPPQIQQRIRGRQGHLSNGDMSDLLARLLHHALRLVVLVHISQENNTRKLAYDSARSVVGENGAEVFVARQNEPTRLFEVVAT